MAEQNILTSLDVKLQKSKVFGFLKSELELLNSTPEMSAMKATNGFDSNVELKKEYSKLLLKLPKLSNESGVYMVFIMNRIISETVAHANEIAKTTNDKFIRAKFMCNSTPNINTLTTYPFLRLSPTFMAEAPELEDLDSAIFRPMIEELTTYKCVGAIKYLTVVGSEIMSHCVKMLNLIRANSKKTKITLSMSELMSDMVSLNTDTRVDFDDLMERYVEAKANNTKTKLETQSDEQKELLVLKKKQAELKTAESKIGRLRAAELKNAEVLKTLQSLPIQTQPELEDKIKTLKSKLDSAKKPKADKV